MAVEDILCRSSVDKALIVKKTITINSQGGMICLGVVDLDEYESLGDALLHKKEPIKLIEQSKRPIELSLSGEYHEDALCFANVAESIVNSALSITNAESRFAQLLLGKVKANLNHATAMAFHDNLSRLCGLGLVESITFKLNLVDKELENVINLKKVNQSPSGDMKEYLTNIFISTLSNQDLTEEEFKSHARYEIRALIPLEAKSVRDIEDNYVRSGVQGLYSNLVYDIPAFNCTYLPTRGVG